MSIEFATSKLCSSLRIITNVSNFVVGDFFHKVRVGISNFTWCIVVVVLRQICVRIFEVAKQKRKFTQIG